MKSRHGVSVARVCLMGIVMLGLVAIVGTGGGGDDGDGNGNGGGGETLLDVYRYSIRMDSEEDPLRVGFTEDDDAYEVAVVTNVAGGIGLTGTYYTDTEAFTLDSGSSIRVDSDRRTPLFGSFSIAVSQAFSFPGEGFPTAGELEVTGTAGTARVTIVSAPAAGVNISLNGGDPAFYSWDDFEDLFDSDSEEWKKWASFAVNVFKFVYEQFDFVIYALEYIGDYGEVLETQGTIQFDCDTFPLLATGTRKLKWVDNGNGSVGPSDSFVWTFADCWIYNSRDNIDDLINGVINLTGYTEVLKDGKITRIGFEPYLETQGGVIYNDLVLTETEEDPPGNFTIDESSELTVNGGMQVVFFE